MRAPHPLGTRPAACTRTRTWRAGRAGLSAWRRQKGGGPVDRPHGKFPLAARACPADRSGTLHVVDGPQKQAKGTGAGGRRITRGLRPKAPQCSWRGHVRATLRLLCGRGSARPENVGRRGFRRCTPRRTAGRSGDAASRPAYPPSPASACWRDLQREGGTRHCSGHCRKRPGPTLCTAQEPASTLAIGRARWRRPQTGRQHTHTHARARAYTPSNSGRDVMRSSRKSSVTFGGGKEKHRTVSAFRSSRASREHQAKLKQATEAVPWRGSQWVLATPRRRCSAANYAACGATRAARRALDAHPPEQTPRRLPAAHS